MSPSQYTATPTSNFRLITKAFYDYAKQTGIDLAEHPSARLLELADSPDAILLILQEREKAFRKHRGRNRTLINCLRPAVQILHAFSGVIGEAASLVSHTSLVRLSCFGYKRFDAISTAFPTGKGCLCWNRCSARRTFYPERSSTGYPVTYRHGYCRLPMGSVRATMLCSISLTASGVSSSALIFTLAFRLPRG